MTMVKVHILDELEYVLVVYSINYVVVRICTLKLDIVLKVVAHHSNNVQTVL